MELSQYVVDAISSISHVDARHHFEAAAQLKDAATKAENERDTHSLEIVSGVLSMSYTLNEHKFSPFVIWNDGRRSFAIEDIAQSDIEILEKAVDATEIIWIRTQLSHVIWHLSNNYWYGQQAVAGYLKIFDEVFDPSSWVDCHNAIQCAFDIAAKLGKASGPNKQVRAAINQKLRLMDGSDPLFLSLRLIQLVIKDATKADLTEYLQFVTKIANRNISASNSNTRLADETYSVQEQVMMRLKKEKDKIAADVKYASYYETQADLYLKKEDYFTAVTMLKKSCTLYGKIDRNKVFRLRSRLEELQEKALEKMQAIPIKFDVKSTYEIIDRLFEGLSLQETIVQLGCIAIVYRVDDIKKQVLKKQKEYFFSSMLGSSILNEKGQTIQEIPPLSEVEADANPDLLHKHMVHLVAKQRGLFDSIVFGYAFGFLKSFGEFSADILDFLVYDNAIIPENREEIIKEGLYLGLTGKLYASMHILLPQTENIFRHLVKMCGDTVTFLKEDGTEEYKPLSALFKSDKLRECYSEDIIFTFQSIMDEPIGENLRNLNAHGLLEPQAGNGSQALSFLCLLIKLLVMYGANARTIASELAKRNPS